MLIQKTLVVALVITTVAATVWVLSFIRSPDISAQTNQTKLYDPPTVDFETELRQAKSKSAEREKRDALYRNEIPTDATGERLEIFKKMAELSRIREFPGTDGPLPTNAHFWQGLPALPAEQSDVVVIGQVKAAAAHMTEDRSGVYSEFTLSIDRVFKAPDSSFRTGRTIDVSRSGGSVRFASGKIQTYTVAHQGYPLVGSVYLFFLKSEKNNLTIVTAYDVSYNRAIPLDGDPAVGLVFEKYRDVPQSDLLRDLQKALATKEGVQK